MTARVARGAACTAALALALSGCSTRAVPKTRLIEGVPRTAAPADGAPTVPTVQTLGLGVAEAPALSAYLNGILDRLKAASPRPDVGARVHVAASYDVWPVAERDGSIFVPIGLIRTLANEDQMAAALGHELAHVLLAHHAADRFGESQQQLLNLALIGMRYGAPLAAAAAGDNTGTVRKIVSTTGDVFQYWQYGRLGAAASKVLIQPAYTREQEEEADLLGADLLVAAGYNVRANYTLLEYVAADEAAKHVPATYGDADAEQRAAAALGKGDLDATAQAGAAWLGSLGSQLLDSAVTSATRQHASATERLATLKAYVDTHYRRAPRTALRTAEWEAVRTDPATAALLANYDQAEQAFAALEANDLETAERLVARAISTPTDTHAFTLWSLYQLRRAQGRTAQATAALEKAMEYADPPLEVMTMLSALYLETRRPEQALELLDRADRRYREPPSTLPPRIAVYKALGRKGDMRRTLLRCETVGSDPLKSACYTAAGETAPAQMPQQGT